MDNTDDNKQEKKSGSKDLWVIPIAIVLPLLTLLV